MSRVLTPEFLPRVAPKITFLHYNLIKRDRELTKITLDGIIIIVKHSNSDEKAHFSQ